MNHIFQKFAFKDFAFKNLMWGLGVAAAVAFAPVAQAQVAVSPMVIRTDARQGQAGGVITLRNRGTEPTRMRLYAEPFSYNRDGFTVEESSPNDLSHFLLFSPRELTIQPGQMRRVRFLSRLLPSQSGKEYRAAIFVEPLRDESQEQPGLRVNTRIGVTVYVRHGELSSKLAVQSAQFNPKAKRIELLANNTGTATVSPRVEWQLKQNDRLVATDQISAITVMAEGERLIPIRLAQDSEPLQPGMYQLEGELSWGDRQSPEILPFELSVSIP